MSLSLFSASMRDWKRVFALSIGVILAVSLVTGIDTGIRTVSGKVLASYLNKLPYDITAEQDSGYVAYVNASQALALADNVYRVDPVFEWTPMILYNQTRTFIGLSSAHGSLTPRNASLTTLGLGSEFAVRYNLTIVAGEWDLTDGVVLAKNTAERLGVLPGDSINLTAYYPVLSNSSIRSTMSSQNRVNSSTVTLKVTGLGIFDALGARMVDSEIGLNSSSTFLFSLPSNQMILSYGALLSAYDFFTARVGVSSLPSLKILHRVFIRRDKIINLFDSPAMLRNVQQVENQLRIETGPYRLIFQDHIALRIGDYQSWLTGNLAVFYLFSLPVLGVSWYVTMTIWFLISGKRRRVFGLLKTRGMSASRIFRSTMLEAVAIGLVGGILGVLTSIITGAVIAEMLDESSGFRLDIQFLTPEIVLTGYTVGLLASVVGAVRPALMAAKYQPVEARKEYISRETDTMRPWRARWTLLASALAIYKMFEWLFGFSPTTIFPSGSPSNDFFASVLFDSWSLLSGLLSFLTPLLFLYVAAKILTRSRIGVYNLSQFVLRATIQDLAEVAKRIRSRNSARVMRASFLMALALSFGVFSIITTSTSMDLQAKAIRLSVGGDINVKTYSPAIGSVSQMNLTNLGEINETLVARIRAIYGIQAVTSMIEAYATSADQPSKLILVNGIDASTFLNVAYGSEDFAVGDPIAAVQQMEAARNGTLLSPDLANSLRLKAGDGLQVNLTNSRISRLVTLSVAGMYNLLPGVGPVVNSGNALPSPASPILGSLVIDSNLIRTLNFTSIIGYTFLVRIQSQGDTGRILNAIQSLVPLQRLVMITLKDAMENFRSNSSTEAPLAFLQLTAFYIILAALVGSTLTSFASAQSRFRETAIYRARGASRLQAANLLFAEAFAVLFIAVSVGIAAGLVEAYSVLKFFTSPESPFPLAANLKFTMSFAQQPLVLLLIATLCFVAASLLPAFIVMKKSVVYALGYR